MAETTEFDHDQLGHVLSDYLVEVPTFQRRYSWEAINVQEYLADLARAREKEAAYFMGTLVFAKPGDGSGRRKIVDGQQRLATTALLLVAIRDRLLELKKSDLAENTFKRYLRRFDIREEGDVDTLILSPGDQDSYDAIINGRASELGPTDKLRACYEECVKHLADLAPTPEEYKALVDVIDQLDRSVQVLVAVASDLPEAYVIFETLNDRGADLTTADLLKNYLFSQAKPSEFEYVQHGWGSLETNLGHKPDEMVRFVRHEYMSRHGRVTTRKLYRAIQDDFEGQLGAKTYVQQLKKAQAVYLALRDTEHEFWTSTGSDVRDALNAYRRFGFESSYPVLLAAFRQWDRQKATRLLVKMAKWSVRAQFVGRLGSGTAEESFGAAAAAIADGSAKNQTEVRRLLNRLVPANTEFKLAFIASGKMTVNRAKYVLAMLEKAAAAKGNRAEPAHDWVSPGVTLEHVMSKSSAGGDDDMKLKVEEIGNLTLLEKRLNKEAGSKAFSVKREFYGASDFRLTKEVGKRESWTQKDITDRTQEMSELACLAWPPQ